MANHDLVLSALEANPGSVLPDPSECFFIFDEGHGLPRKIVQHYAVRHPARAAHGWFGEVPDVVRGAVHALRADSSMSTRADAACSDIGHALGRLWRWIEEADGWNEDILRFPQGVIPAELAPIGEALLAAAWSVLDLLGELRSQAMKRAAQCPQLVQQLLADVGTHIARAERVADTWTLMMRHDRAGTAPTARWLERGEGNALICASPIEAGERLQQALWKRVSAAVVTSATLTVNGTFDLFMRQTGLERLSALKTLRLASPFDYGVQARLVIPHMESDPTNAAAHTAEVAALLPHLVREGASLVLFASAAQMLEVCRRLPESCKDHILVQGDLSKAMIIQRHRAWVDAGNASAIFGLAAFQEGVDLPGDYCTHVVIVKLPFAVPVHPWEQARAEWLQRCGRSPFHELVVPEACVRLAQAVGRLIRTPFDRGTVTILDHRLVRRGYGKKLLRSLPPMQLQVGTVPSDGSGDRACSGGVDCRNGARTVYGPPATRKGST